MKISNKLIIAIIMAITIMLAIYAMNGNVYAKSEWNINTYYYGPTWGGGLHANNACYDYNNIYCIQRGWAYNDDAFYTQYKIIINGEDATLYYRGSKKYQWSCHENNVMAGIISAGKVHGKTVGIRESGNLKTGTISDVQDGIYGYWGDFEGAMNRELGYQKDGLFDWRI